MKGLLKYIWILALIPALGFLKSDLNASIFVATKQSHAKEFAESVKTVMQPSAVYTLVINIKPVPKNNNFSADGMLVQLFDENYTLIDNSQVIGGKVKFELGSKYLKLQHFKVVAPATADEMQVTNLENTYELSVHEDQLTELEVQ